MTSAHFTDDKGGSYCRQATKLDVPPQPVFVADDPFKFCNQRQEHADNDIKRYQEHWRYCLVAYNSQIIIWDPDKDAFFIGWNFCN